MSQMTTKKISDQGCLPKYSVKPEFQNKHGKHKKAVLAGGFWFFIFFHIRLTQDHHSDGSCHAGELASRMFASIHSSVTREEEGAGNIRSPIRASSLFFRNLPRAPEDFQNFSLDFIFEINQKAGFDFLILAVFLH